MHIKDHSAAMKFFRTYDNVASKGKWKEFVDEMEFESMVQEPRITAQEPRIGLAGGQLVQPGPGRQGYQGKTSGIGTGIKAIDDPKVIKQAEDILKKLVKKKHGHKVLDWSEKATHPLLKNLPIKSRRLNDIINIVVEKNGWLNGTEYKNTMVVETFMDE